MPRVPIISLPRDNSAPRSYSVAIRVLGPIAMVASLAACGDIESRPSKALDVRFAPMPTVALAPGATTYYSSSFLSAWTTAQSALERSGYSRVDRNGIPSDIDSYVRNHPIVTPHGSQVLLSIDGHPYTFAELGNRLLSDSTQFSIVSMSATTFQFDPPLSSMEGGLVFKSSDAGIGRVRSFGVAISGGKQAMRQAERVMAHPGETDREFVIELMSTDEQSRVHLAMVPPSGSLLNTWSRAREIILRGRGVRLSDCAFERLSIPVISLSHRSQVAGFSSTTYRGSSGRVATIVDATVETALSLDRGGGSMVCSASVEAMLGDGPPPIMEFDRPFLLAVSTRELEPYFLCWFGDRSCMQPASGR